MAKVLSTDSLRLFMHISRQSSVDICGKFKQLSLSTCKLKLTSSPIKQHCEFCTSGSAGSDNKLTLRSRLLTGVQPLLPQTLVCLPKKHHIHTSPTIHGLEEFFEDKKNIGEDKVKSGRAWKVEELRLKDNVTLHKLWYVFLKERNMLMTMEEESERQRVYMQSPERLDKVAESMQNLKQVLKERDEAFNLLTTGQKELHPGRWQNTAFGFKRFVRPKEYLIPQHMNRYAATKRKRYGDYMLPLMREWLEQQLRSRRKGAKRERQRVAKLRKRFPDSDYWKED